MKQVKLSEIVIDAGTQTRAEINKDTVQEYAIEMKYGAKFPPVVLFGKILADGFHRVAAAKSIKLKTILADMREGSKADALSYSIGANGTHGLRRTNADKRKAVEMALQEWPDLSEREVAKRCGVSHTFIANSKKPKVATVATSKLDNNKKTESESNEGEENPPEPEEQKQAASSNGKTCRDQVSTYLTGWWKKNNNDYDVDTFVKLQSDLLDFVTDLPPLPPDPETEEERKGLRYRISEAIRGYGESAIKNFDNRKYIVEKCIKLALNQK